jgi:NhaA family Na+:H+ antiporter
MFMRRSGRQRASRLQRFVQHAGLVSRTRRSTDTSDCLTYRQMDPQTLVQAPAPSAPQNQPRIPALQITTERLQEKIAHLLHIESFAGMVLMLAAAAALIWANSPWAASYFATWHAPVAVTLGPWSFSTDLHFIVNDVLMTIFFLVVGMEIRRELHDGALASLRQASLPLIAAIGGVVVPALIYVFWVGNDKALLNGWAIPTATDIAFAVGVLALLGRNIPGALRIFLLALAIIDDIVAVLIIAFFYSGGLQAMGFVIAGAGVLLVLLFNRMGIASAPLYVLPGAVLWFGLLKTGAHPTLAGVVLGLMTPVFVRPAPTPLLITAQAAMRKAGEQMLSRQPDPQNLLQNLRAAQLAQRDLLPPALRLPMILHPWVAFCVMPIFALANAGVQFSGVDLSATAPQATTMAVLIALVLGKPLGVFICTWLAVRSGLCNLPAGLNWRGVLLVGLLAGIGFTMSIFVGGLAFEDATLLGAAKLGILAGSAIAAVLGLGYGFAMRKRLQHK